MTTTPNPTSTTAPEADAYQRAADRLARAAREHTPCSPIRDLLGATDLAAGYAIQRRLTHAAVESGRRIVGAKIGLTSRSVQRQLGVDRPDFGVLFADMQRPQHEPIDLTELLQPRIEAEIAFILNTDLARPDLDIDTVRAGVGQVVPALEIVDSRITSWDISLVDTIADNASSGLYVLGDELRPLAGLNLPQLAMSMTAGADLVSEGTGADCLGDPCEALLWLARTAHEFGAPLRAGDLVLSGALGPMVPVQPGTTYTASVEGLGTARASFGKESQ
ncbi:MAG: 2-keto-4-pentenoate hydratase [Sciscionella sp.]